MVQIPLLAGYLMSKLAFTRLYEVFGVYTGMRCVVNLIKTVSSAEAAPPFFYWTRRILETLSTPEFKLLRSAHRTSSG